MKIKKKTAKKIAKQLESFVELIDGFFRIENITKEEHDEAVAYINKVIKKLRKGETKGIIQKDVFKTLMIKDRGFREEYGDGVVMSEDDEDDIED